MSELKPAGSASIRLRPEVPSFQFSSPANTDIVRCSRCDHAVESFNAFCPQCGANLSAPSPLGDAAHNSIRPAPVGPGITVLGAAAMPVSPEWDADGPGEVEAQCRHPASRPVSTIRPAAPDTRPGPVSNAAATPCTPVLHMIAPDGSVSRVFPLVGDRIDLGRTEGEVLLRDDCYLSGRHARFTWESGELLVQDLGSLNGVFLKLRQPVVLQPSDSFLVGLQLLRFELEPADTRQSQPIRVSGCTLFGSAASPRHARLHELTNDGLPRNIFFIGADETILGREVGDIVFTGDPFMSRRHAAITRDPATGDFMLQDLGSSNGTFVRIRGKTELRVGDHLRIGQQLFRFDTINP